MENNILNRFHDMGDRGSRRVPLRTILVTLFALQLFGTVGLIGYFFFRIGQQTVHDSSSQLMALAVGMTILTAQWFTQLFVRLSEAYNSRALEQQVASRIAALQASEEKFAAAFRVSPVAMGILTFEDGRYIDVNNSFCRAVGYDREQVIGQSCLELNLWKYPEERTRFFKLIEENRSIRDQEVEFCQQSGETLMIRASGEVINLDQTPCILLTYEDVTAHRQAEEALRRQEQELRLITDALPVCICYVDPEKRYRFVNRTYEDWFGWRRDEILGKHYREVLGEAVYQIIKPHSNRTLAGAVTTYEADMPYLLGRKYSSATLIPDVDDRGQVRGYYGLVSDISDRKRAEAASVLEERNRMAREIHDTLAQALTSIIIHLEAASLKLATDVESAQALIQTGRDLARSGLAEARRSVEALRPMILENCDLYGALQQFAEQMFSCTESQVTCHRLGHPYLLESSVENNVFRIGQEALHNILKHAKASEIKMELIYERSWFTLKITDNGQGFVVGNNAGGRFGLLGMSERAERMGASFAIQSRLKRGTTITLSIDRRILS
jgi:PAS domain S-box-containing protein